jgi:uncharacterized protein
MYMATKMNRRKWMRRNKWIMAGLALLVLGTMLMVGCQSGSAVSGSNNQQTGIWVTGEGKVTVVPDIATIQLGVQAQADTVANAQTQAATAMDSVMAALQTNGVVEKDIQTQYFSIQKVTRWDSDKQQEITIGYQVSNIVTAKVRDVTTAGTVIDSVVAAGGDLVVVNSITFSVDDPILYYDEARQEAMANAHDKAKGLADLANVTLGNAIYITESTSSTGIRPVAYDSKLAAEGASTAINAGETEIILDVQVAYAIR